MSGKAITGIAAVYFVAGELSRLGYTALVTTRNTQAYDILVHNPRSNKSLALQVKSIRQMQKNPRDDTFPGVVKANDRTLESELKKIRITYVFVYFPSAKYPRYFVVEPIRLRKLIRYTWQWYLRESHHRKPLESIKKAEHPLGPWVEILEPYENNWKVIETIIGRPYSN